MINKDSQKGEVSLFVVIFSTLLMTIVTISFVRIMMQGQQQANTDDLSQSAYDSATTGVEDAKRAILAYLSICATGTAEDCSKAKASLTSDECNESVGMLLDDLKSTDAYNTTTGEVDIKTNSNDSALAQAYSCVKIILDTEDYLGHLDKDEQRLIPIEAVGGVVDSVKIEWFKKSDRGDALADIPSPVTYNEKLLSAVWPANRPPIMRTQFIQVGDNFNLSGFDSHKPTTPTESNSATAFLYPNDLSTTLPLVLTAYDSRRMSESGGPVPVECSKSDTVKYSCSAEIKLPEPVGGGLRTAFLNLKSLYGKSDFRVTLYKAGVLVRFNAVQPLVDSTGRANNLFRRVQSRLELMDVFPYPDSAVNVSGKLCKDFYVSDHVDEYDTQCEVDG